MSETATAPEDVCEHPNMTYDRGRGTSTCPDCGYFLDPFEGLAS